jgi:hypothetical protein
LYTTYTKETRAADIFYPSSSASSAFYRTMYFILFSRDVQLSEAVQVAWSVRFSIFLQFFQASYYPSYLYVLFMFAF